MKVFILTCALAVTVLASELASVRDYKKIENFDFRGLLANEVYDYRSSMDCFLDRIPCQDVRMKEILLEILETQCAYCTPIMLQKYNWVLATLKELHPEDYNAIMNKISIKDNKKST